MIEKEKIEIEDDEEEQEIDGWDAICDKCDYYYDLENFG